MYFCRYFRFICNCHQVIRWSFLKRFFSHFLSQSYFALPSSLIISFPGTICLRKGILFFTPLWSPTLYSLLEISMRQGTSNRTHFHSTSSAVCTRNHSSSSSWKHHANTFIAPQSTAICDSFPTVSAVMQTALSEDSVFKDVNDYIYISLFSSLLTSFNYFSISRTRRTPTGYCELSVRHRPLLTGNFKRTKWRG